MRLLSTFFLFCFAYAVQPANFSLPITVAKLASGSEFAIARASIDFSELLRAQNPAGLVDERSLRLFQMRGSDRVEIPYQFTPAPQPRPRSRPLLAGTSPNVSYAAEYSATNATSQKVAGEISWVVAIAEAGRSAFALEFSTPEAGRAIQTPFPPENFRMFDSTGRATRVPWFPSLQLHPQWPFDGVVHFYENQKLITSYHLGPSLNSTTGQFQFRRPFFYPVNGPDDISFTEFGKPHDPTGSHAHHYSLWIAHNSVDGTDFWSERGGIIAHASLDQMEDGPIFSRLVQKARWKKEAREILQETRTITTYKSAGDFRAIDIEIALTPAASNAVTFGKTTFGFLAARVAQSMTVFDGAGEIRTSAGKLNESGAHLTHAAWLDQSGPIAQDKWGGIAILDSPENSNFPTGWHCRNDGWAGAAFNIDAAYTLQPGKTLPLRYRLILHRGDAAKGNIEQRFEEWAARPEIQFGAVKKI